MKRITIIAAAFAAPAPQPARVEAPAPELIEPIMRPDLHGPVRSWDPPRVILQ